MTARRQWRRQDHTAEMGSILAGRDCRNRADITDKKRLEEALSRAEHRYYNVFRAMAVSFWELHFTGVGRMVERLRRAGETTAWISRRQSRICARIDSRDTSDRRQRSQRVHVRERREGEMLAGLEPYRPEASFPV